MKKAEGPGSGKRDAQNRPKTNLQTIGTVARFALIGLGAGGRAPPSISLCAAKKGLRARGAPDNSTRLECAIDAMPAQGTGAGADVRLRAVPPRRRRVPRLPAGRRPAAGRAVCRGRGAAGTAAGEAVAPDGSRVALLVACLCGALRVTGKKSHHAVLSSVWKNHNRIRGLRQ